MTDFDQNVTDQNCWDFINANFWNTHPMTEQEFNSRGWTSVRRIGPTQSGEWFLAGVRGDLNSCQGFYNLQTEVGCFAPCGPLVQQEPQ